MFPDSTRKVDEVLETSTVRGAYRELHSPYTINQRRQQKRENKSAQEDARRHAKRRKSQQPSDFSPLASDKELQTILQANAKLAIGELSAGSSTPRAGDGGTRRHLLSPSRGKDHGTHFTTAPFDGINTDNGENSEANSEVEIITEPSTTTSAVGTATAPPLVRFYLLRPFTRGTQRVLHPLLEDKTIFEVLQGQEIFEFPTVYVLETGPEKLPAGFITEEEYAAQTTKLIAEVDTELQGLRNPEFKDTSGSSTGAPPEVGAQRIGGDVDEAQVMASLRRDMLRQ